MRVLECLTWKQDNRLNPRFLDTRHYQVFTLQTDETIILIMGLRTFKFRLLKSLQPT